MKLSEHNRRQGHYTLLSVKMEVAKTMMKNKRMWEDDHDTQPEKKQKDPWNLMGKAGER